VSPRLGYLDRARELQTLGRWVRLSRLGYSDRFLQLHVTMSGQTRTQLMGGDYKLWGGGCGSHVFLSL
jgi:hypothetical protein